MIHLHALSMDKNTSTYQNMLVILSKQHHFVKYDFNPVFPGSGY